MTVPRNIPAAHSEGGAMSDFDRLQPGDLGVGPVLAILVLASLPDLSNLEHGNIAALVGLALPNWVSHPLG
jgi:hypothetical protein